MKRKSFTENQLSISVFELHGLFSSYLWGVNVRFGGLGTDFDGDGQVGFLDLLLFVDAFDSREGQENYDAKYDLNSNGEIDFPDFLLFIDNYGKEVSTPSGGDSGAMYCPLI